MDMYWELVTKDDTRYEISPSAVEIVNRKMANHDPVVLKTATIPYAEVKHFRITSKPYSSQPLLEAAAQAFNEPVMEGEAVTVRWVKKSVPNREYQKQYSIPAYRKIGDQGGMVIVAFRQPIHLIDTQRVDYCSDDEVAQLTKV